MHLNKINDYRKLIFLFSERARLENYSIPSLRPDLQIMQFSPQSRDNNTNLDTQIIVENTTVHSSLLVFEKIELVLPSGSASHPYALRLLLPFTLPTPGSSHP